MKWGAAIVVLALLLSIVLVDEWREVVSREPTETDRGGEREHSARRSLESSDQTSVDELVEQMLAYEDRWDDAGVNYEEFPEKHWEVIQAWSLAEVEALCRQESGGDWSEALFERWVLEVKEEAVSFVLSLEKTYAEEFMQAKNSLEGGPGEAEVREVGLDLNAVLAGWARSDPHAAWLAADDPEGLIRKSEAFEGYGDLAPIKVFEHLSKKDPDFALEEFMKHEDPMFQGSMLKGMVRGLSPATDWAELMRKVLSTENVEHRDITAVLRGGVLGRWMEVNAEEAESWFRGDEGISISRMVEETVERQWPDPFESDDYKDVITKVVVTDVSLAPAVRHWAASDKEGAIAWLREHSELVPEIPGAENWLDPDDLGTGGIREILVACYPAGQREELLRGYLDAEDVFHSPLNRLFVANGREQLRKEVAELVVSEELGDEIVESISRVRGLRDEDPKGGMGLDPFGSE
ncbi:hypothetical protein N9062_00725 [Akkermansiaceae bacterium]|nr:hypothetical protein [Akkermansiaceae bacterium]MDB4509502.1 hypothetical protein [Akkermansiaceae bacterium]